MYHYLGLTSTYSTSFECEACQLEKNHRTSFPLRVNNVSSCMFNLIHSDIWGLILIPNTLSFRYFLRFVDDHSRTTLIYFLKDRSKYLIVIDSFYHEIKTKFGVSLKILQSDNSLEY